MKRNIILTLILILLSGCTGESRFDEASVPVPSKEPELAAVSKIGADPVSTEEYRLYSQKDDYRLSVYEPSEGCYLGAYVLSNKKINFDMEEFDSITERKHSLFMYNMKLGDPFPVNWILSCISLMKTPYIVILPPNEYQPFDENLLEKTAKEFGEFYIPVFVDFYPLTGNTRYNSEAYKAFYQKARAVFKEHASNAAFVWSVSSDNILGAMDYYPGDDAIDWAGVSLYLPVKNDPDEYGIYGSDILHDLDYFYYSFQKTKPIVISQLAISHYTDSDHVYRTKEAAKEITRIYESIITEYPRIKAVIYMDFNGIQLSSRKGMGNNFSITEDSIIREAYSSVIQNEKFLSALDMASSGDTAPQMLRSPFPVIKLEEEYYISEKTVDYDLDVQDTRAYQPKTIHGRPYFRLSDINSLQKIKIEEDEKKIILN